jgi:hypothetical protein
MLNFVLKELSLKYNVTSSKSVTAKGNFSHGGPNMVNGSVSYTGSESVTGSEPITGSASDTGSGKSFRLYWYLGGLLFVASVQPFIKSQYYFITTAMSSYINSGLTGLVYKKVRKHIVYTARFAGLHGVVQYAGYGAVEYAGHGGTVCRVTVRYSIPGHGAVEYARYTVR